MSEQKPDLRNHLEKLDAELQRTQPADDAQRQQLEALHGDVRAALERPGELSPEEHESLSQRFTESLQHFEATHTALTSLIEQALSTLSNAGI